MYFCPLKSIYYKEYIFEMENVNDTPKIERIREKKEEVEVTKEKVVVANNGLNIFERILELNRKYTFGEIMRSILITVIVVFFGFIGYALYNPSWMMERYREVEKVKHTEELHKRFKETKLINSELKDIMHKLHADRAFFIEYHNSVKSLEGAPFAFGSMGFETTSDDALFIGDEYTNFSLTKYPMVNYLYDNLLFVGEITEIDGIDKRLSIKLQSNDIKQIALIEVEGTEVPLGILGITWSKHDVMSTYKEQIKKELRSGSVRISFILNSNTNE